MALQIGVLVAFTQIIPEHQVQLFGVLKARVKVGTSSSLHLRNLTIGDIDPSNGIRNILDCNVSYWLPVPLYRHPVRLAGVVHLAPVLQEELGGSAERRPRIWRPKRDVCFRQLVPSFHPVSGFHSLHVHASDGRPIVPQSHSSPTLPMRSRLNST